MSISQHDLAAIQRKLPLSAACLKRNQSPITIEEHKAQLTQDLDTAQRMTITKSTDEEKLNKTEKAYLAYLRGPGNDLTWIGIQNITFKLAHDTRFTPDFTVIDQGNMRCIDVKGFQREDALIKIKVAARLFPFTKFIIVKRDKGGSWHHQEVTP